MRAAVRKSDERKAFRNLDRFLSAVHHEAEAAAKAEAEDYVALVKSGIGKTVGPGWAPAWEPLSYYWMSMKTANSDKFWMETGGILKAVDTKMINNTRLKILVFAGIRKADDPDAFERALRNEYGLGLGPERPLFLPAMDHVSTRVGGGRRRLNNMARFRAVVPLAIRKVWR